MSEQSNKDSLLELVQKNVKVTIDLAGLTEDIIDTFLDQWLQKLVDDSANPLDNMLKASLMPIVKAEIMKLVNQAQKTGPINLFDILEKLKDKKEA